MEKRKWTDREVQQWYLLHNTPVYANKEDSSIVVRKYKRMGWTVNWANPLAWVMQGAILAAVFALVYFLN